MTESMTTEPQPIAPPKLAIFDCDGVLVDSEALINRALGRLLADCGLQLQPNEIRTHFRGLSNSRIEDVLITRWGMSLPENFTDMIEDAERIAMEDGLRAIPGVADAVRSVVVSGVATCVASNGSPDAIVQRLNLTGLYHWFEGRLFSAALVERGKPYPDVFLYAAEKMGFPPSDCVVIEDSEAGIQAGKAAGMRVLTFAADADTAAAEAAGVEAFTDMASLPALLGLETNPTPAA